MSDAGLPASDLAELRALIEADRERTAERLAFLTRDLTGIVESAALVATDDEHDPEGSSTAFERAHVQALLDQAREHLRQLDLALGRMAAGTYGTCERCGRPIPVERLRIRPATTTCVTCAARSR
ncbi:TraR/DksA family transcriptional regulator [Actinopolymorpha singaporensis]|uniref:RNA polymerase-binding transcription factor DksA n=1 Tax=Actinopolymorpha singaporensis TaxID=117157 RepID=A0A1H1MCL6_9ACTN|nr:TraR/DksA C4-type zinc finger protein [Actinopolymorpha singaporensis]SDR84397.1 RNA polymerase-binding transcription factor DksA [Actinopolymorpha singaporensis]